MSNFSEAFVVGRTIFLWDVLEHHVEFFLRIVGKLQEEKSVESVVKVRVDIEAQELRAYLEVFLEQSRHAVVAVAELHEITVKLVD